MEDFQKTIKKGETFNILACSPLKQKIDSLPHPYLRKGDRSNILLSQFKKTFVKIFSKV